MERGKKGYMMGVVTEKVVQGNLISPLFRYSFIIGLSVRMECRCFFNINITKQEIISKIRDHDEMDDENSLDDLRMLE